MAIGTSLGGYFESDFHHFAGVEDDSVKEDTTASGRPPGGSTEPAGALKSETGSRVPENPSPAKPDYDYESWQKANPGVQMAPGQHYPDTYKLPNHITFSDESMYHGGDNQGGHWGTNEQGKDTFTPGPTNLKNYSMEALQDYFKRVEPDAVLLPPPNTDSANALLPEGSFPVAATFNAKKDVELVKGFYDTVKNAFGLAHDVYGGKIDPMSDQGIERAFDLAGMMVAGPAPVAAKMADGTLGSF